MRACLFLCAALALAPSRPRAAASHLQPQLQAQPQPAHQHRHLPEPRLEHIKTQILAKLGLSSRPTPLGAPPRDVVRQILARAADPQPEHLPEPEQSMREIIAIAHRGVQIFITNDSTRFKSCINIKHMQDIVYWPNILQYRGARCRTKYDTIELWRCSRSNETIREAEIPRILQFIYPVGNCYQFRATK